MKRLILKYGFTCSGILIGLGLLNWFVIAKNLGYQASQISGYISIITALLCITLGIKYYRDQENNGKLSLIGGMKIGLGISLVTSVVMFFYGMLFHLMAGEEFHKWQEKGLTQDEIQKLAEMPEYVMTPWFQGIIMFTMIFTFGTIITIISSLAFKR